MPESIKLTLNWMFVLIPLGWGVYEVFVKSLALFN